MVSLWINLVRQHPIKLHLSRPISSHRTVNIHSRAITLPLQVSTNNLKDTLIHQHSLLILNSSNNGTELHVPTMASNQGTVAARGPPTITSLSSPTMTRTIEAGVPTVVEGEATEATTTMETSTIEGNSRTTIEISTPSSNLHLIGKSKMRVMVKKVL